MQIRSAQPSDAAQLTRLSEQLGYKSQEEHILQRLKRVLSDEDHAVFIMEVDGDVAGWVHVHGRHLIESADFAEIGGLVVDSNHRRKGIGEQLMRQCEAWARVKGYEFVRVRSSGQRKEAHEFYQRIGYTNVKSQQVFHLDLMK